MNTLRNVALRVAVPAIYTALTAGCITYTPGQIGALSSLELCEIRSSQGANLAAETKRALDSELQRRSDDCRNHASVIAQRREEALYRDMYGKHDDP